MEPLDTLELHVLARAYRAAWRSIHAGDPMGWHVIDSLHVMIVFGDGLQSGSAVHPAHE